MLRGLRACWRVLRLVLHAAQGLLVVALRFPRLSVEQQQARVQVWALGLLACAGVTLEVRGTPPSQGPVLLHCASGNRAGAVLGLVNARYEHASPEQALRLGQRAGLKSLETATRQRLATPVTSP